jgi:hypothetical protein
MANKRQKKKQQAKQNIRLLESLGINRKKAERVKNKPQEVKQIVKVRTKEIKQENRKRTATERAHYLKQHGYKVSEHAAKRYWSEEHWKAWVNEQEALRVIEEKKVRKREKQREYRERKKKEAAAGQRVVLQLYWKDRTDTALDDSTLHYVKESGQEESIRELVYNLNEARNYTSGEIGDYKIEVTKNPRQVESYYHGEYFKQYEGNGTQYKKLLIAIGAMMSGLYYPHEKEIFLYELVTKMQEVNPKAARRLQEDFNLYV